MYMNDDKMYIMKAKTEEQRRIGKTKHRDAAKLLLGGGIGLVPFWDAALLCCWQSCSVFPLS